MFVVGGVNFRLYGPLFIGIEIFLRQRLRDEVGSLFACSFLDLHLFLVGVVLHVFPKTARIRVFLRTAHHLTGVRLLKQTMVLINSYIGQMKVVLTFTVSKWVLWCLALSELLEKLLVQLENWQRYGRSPVWLLWWILRFSSLEKALLHPLNWNKTSLLEDNLTSLVLFHIKRGTVFYLSSKCLIIHN